MSTIAIIVAAGSGTRAGGEIPKQYQEIGGKPVICHTIDAFISHGAIDDIVVVISPEHREFYDNATTGYPLGEPVNGGSTRQQSVFNGLEAIKDDNPSKVLIHDAARPFVSPAIISNVIAELDTSAGAIPGVAVVDTVSQVTNGQVTSRLNRDELRAIQTPQGFVFEAIFAAHEKAIADGNNNASDDSSLVSPVAVVAGEAINSKITTNEDIAKADIYMKQTNLADLGDIRVGQGFDVHAFEAGDHVVLCGIKIPFTAKLKGHSDADVAMHALTDAILGAISEGDIGKHFPPSEAQWKGAASDIFLKKSVDLVAQRGGIVAHCDVTIICEAPKLRPHIDPMRAQLASIMAMEIDRISIKATTSEQLGFTGRGEGIAAMATATIRLPS